MVFLTFWIWAQTTDLTPPVKDWENFEIPLKLREAMPYMQDQIYMLLPYETQRYQVKPNFVFIDRDVKNEGMLNVLVANMSILHLAYYQGKNLTWYGSLYFQTRRGGTFYSKEGFEVDLLPVDGSYTLSLHKKDLPKLIVQLPQEEDKALKLVSGDQTLYAYLFLLPTSIPPD